MVGLEFAWSWRLKATLQVKAPLSWKFGPTLQVRALSENANFKHLH